jgi:hypothetical protein
MTLMWTILLVWLALQLPLGMLVGKSIKWAAEEGSAKARRYARVGRDGQRKISARHAHA